MVTAITQRSSKLTQAQRSESTRNKLVAATIECLIEKGYAQTSTQVVCTAAGVSKGGLFRQYKSRTELMIAAADAVYQTLIEQFEHDYSEDDSASSPHKLVSHIRRVFQRREFQAALELTIAARTDAAMHDGLVSILQRNIELVLGIARGRFPKAAAENPKFDATIHMLVMVFQGEVLDDLVFNTAHLSEARFQLLVEIAERELAVG